MNILNNLKLAHWSKFIFYLSAIFLLLAFTVEIKGITNKDLIIFSIGGLLIGFGEILNHLWITIPAGAGYYEGYTRKLTASGFIIETAGVALIVYRLYKIM